MASEKQTGKNGLYICFAKCFLGDIEEITSVAATTGETRDTAGYEVCGASACGRLCRGKKRDRVYTN